MKRSRIVIVAMVGVLGVAAALLFWPRLPSGVSSALDSADTFELISVALEPAVSERMTSPTDFHGYRVLGRTTVADPAVRRQLATALRGGVASASTPLPLCFNPRLGLRLIRGGHTTELLVCFGCEQGYAWRDGEPVGHWVTDQSPGSAFDAVLTAAGVPLVAGEE